eukprot:6464856-Amphidinium_carterae.2
MASKAISANAVPAVDGSICYLAPARLQHALKSCIQALQRLIIRACVLVFVVYAPQPPSFQRDTHTHKYTACAEVVHAWLVLREEPSFNLCVTFCIDVLHVGLDWCDPDGWWLTYLWPYLCESFIEA